MITIDSLQQFAMDMSIQAITDILVNFELSKKY